MRFDQASIKPRAKATKRFGTQPSEQNACLVCKEISKDIGAWLRMLNVLAALFQREPFCLPLQGSKETKGHRSSSRGQSPLPLLACVDVRNYQLAGKVSGQTKL